MRISGTTSLLAHIGYPTHAFRSPLIYNPYFEHAGIDAVVMPMGCRAEHYPVFLRAVFTLANIQGALITMPHKVTTAGLVDELTQAAKVSGACNAVRRLPDGRLEGNMLDGDGFVNGLRRRNFKFDGARALVVGCGGVGSAISASLAAAGIGALSLYDIVPGASAGLRERLARYYPKLDIAVRSNDPAGYELVVNATPMGMNDDDPLSMDASRIAPGTFVGEVVMKQDMTPFLRAAKARGCRFQMGVDMLFEQIPIYLEYFGLPSTTPDVLRSLAATG